MVHKYTVVPSLTKHVLNCSKGSNQGNQRKLFLWLQSNQGFFFQNMDIQRNNIDSILVKTEIEYLKYIQNLFCLYFVSLYKLCILITNVFCV